MQPGPFQVHATAIPMPEPSKPSEHVEPFVHDGPDGKALHFSISETQSRMRPGDPTALALAYTRTMMGFLLFHAQPQQLAMIGLGGGSLAKFCHCHLPRTQIVVVEINPHVIALRDQFQVPPDDARLSVRRGDGALFVRDPANACDVLLADAFDSDGLPARLCSPRFYNDCHALLRPGGLLVANLHFGHPRFEVLVERISRAFDGRVLLADDGELSNTIVFARKGTGFKARRPTSLDAVAARALAPTFALLRSALRKPPSL